MVVERLVRAVIKVDGPEVNEVEPISDGSLLQLL